MTGWSSVACVTGRLYFVPRSPGVKLLHSLPSDALSCHLSVSVNVEATEGIVTRPLESALPRLSGSKSVEYPATRGRRAWWATCECGLLSLVTVWF